MKPREITELVRVSRPPAPYGARRLARTYSIEDIARVARKRLARGALNYHEGGGEGEYTLRRNRAAFDELEVVPSALHEVSEIDTSTTVLGTELPVSIILSPVGGPRLLHHEGELAGACCVGCGEAVPEHGRVGRSDRVHQLVEGSGDAQVRSGVGAELVVASSKVLHKGVSLDDHLSAAVALEPSHGPQSGL